MPVDEVSVGGRMVSGEPKILNRDYLVSVYRQWPEGAEITLTLKRTRAKTSDLQRAYWWAIVVPMIAQETGDDEQSTHEDLKRQFIPKVTKVWRSKRTGRKRRRTHHSIMALDTKQMTDLIDTVRKWAGEFLNLEIPEPDPAWRSNRRERKAAA